MGLNIYNIKKWYSMLTGKSVLHVNQDIGKHFVPGSLKGYYNNMMEKVTLVPKLLDTTELPTFTTEKGEVITFPVAIFQYGLGAYDIYLAGNDERCLRKFLQCADWAIANQESNGAFNNFSYIYPDTPYGSMCQGEAASLLLRAWCETGKDIYFVAAKKAIDFMLKAVSDGGTALTDGGLCLLEYTHRPAVLNGWIFAIFGLYDMTLASNDVKYMYAFQETIKTLIVMLPNFDCGYWSLYDLERRMTSPFYHNLHIAQMQALYALTGEKIFHDYDLRWSKFKNSFWNSKRAFVTKVFQKIME